MSKQKYPTASPAVSTDGKPKQGKVNGYHSEKLHAARDKKRQEAKARQRHYESLTIKQRIALAKSRHGNSKKELAHLANLLNSPAKLVDAVKSVNPQPVVVAVTEKKTRKSDIVKAAKAQRPSKS